MPLQIGDRFGSHQIVALLGTGGMGAVYRARDTKLNREVALKVLLPEVANDSERLARFRREAQVLASLNHPHIGTIHGLEESDDTIALVLELVPGSTLADLIWPEPASDRQDRLGLEDVGGRFQHRPVQRSNRVLLRKQSRHLAAQVQVVVARVVHERLALRRVAFERRLVQMRHTFPALRVHVRRFSA